MACTWNIYFSRNYSIVISCQPIKVQTSSSLRNMEQVCVICRTAALALWFHILAIVLVACEKTGHVLMMRCIIKFIIKSILTQIRSFISFNNSLNLFIHIMQTTFPPSSQSLCNLFLAYMTNIEWISFQGWISRLFL